MANYFSSNSVFEGDRSLIQGCDSASMAEQRLAGFTTKSTSIKSFAFCEMFPHSFFGYVNFPFDPAIKIYSSVWPLNGGYPHNIMYIMTPQLHISHFSLYDPFITSGAV